MVLSNESVHQYSSSDELLDAQTHVWNQIFNFINSMSLKCAIQLGIPDIIHKHGKPMTLSELANALPINQAKSHNIPRLMRILIHSKFFVKINVAEAKEEAYWLTPASRLLLTNEPFSIAPLALAMLDPIMIDPWHCMSEWFQSDSSTPFTMAHGLPFWEYTVDEPRLSRVFGEAMASDAHLVAKVLVRDCKQAFQGLESMVDVAGGTGVVANAIADACPGLKCTVLDLPHVVAGQQGNENVTYIGGDMFKSIPKANAVFLKWILHDWNDEECVRLLRKCKEAIVQGNGGKVIIVDIIVGDRQHDHEATETQYMFDILMMNNLTGKERTEKEWAKLFNEAGFKSYKITHVLGLRSVIEVFP